MERKCAECGSTQFVHDTAQGDIVCKGCGLVAEGHVIDERSEWRTFSDKDKAGDDPNRVGGPTNPLLENNMTTMIGKGDGSNTLSRLHMRNNAPDRALQTAFRTLGTLVEKLDINNQSIKDTGCEIYKKAWESGRLRGRAMLAICAACIYLACRQHNTPRSFKDITAIMPPEVAKKDIGRCFKEIMEIMKEGGSSAAAMQAAPVAQHPADHIRRFASTLHLGFELQKLCQEMAMNCKPPNQAVRYPWDGRSPLTIAAAVIYVITSLRPDPQDPIRMQDIVLVTNVTEGTIRTAYREFFPYLRNLLPKALNNEDSIQRLTGPGAREDGYAAAVPLY